MITKLPPLLWYGLFWCGMAVFVLVGQYFVIKWALTAFADEAMIRFGHLLVR